ncbi:MAG: Na+/H+ antiporter NhaC family protein [bacterium]
MILQHKVPCAALILFVTLQLISCHLLHAQEEVPDDRSVPAAFKVNSPELVLRNIEFDITVQAIDQDGNLLKSFAGRAKSEGILIKSDSSILEPDSLVFIQGEAVVKSAVIKNTGVHTISVSIKQIRATSHIRVIPGLLSLLPPVLAIALAFIARQVLISLFCGVWLGCLFIFNYNPFAAFGKALDTYLIQSLADPSHAAILIFSMTLGGMVGVISKAGGTQGIVEKLAKLAKSNRGGQIATWSMGIFIFFDDYANSLIVGNTMRPFTDRLRISREKLSYIVDSTAAPIASIALVSTWIGFQVGLIDQVFKSLNLPDSAYGIFLQSIPYASYSILALIFVFIIGLSLKDFGPMWTAETRAAQSGKVLRDGARPLTDSSALDMIADDDVPLRWVNALLPIAVVILVTLFGLYFDGKGAVGQSAQSATLGEIYGAANSFNVLLWASFCGLLVAAILAMSQKILNLNETITATLNGYKSMFLAAMILILAWAIGEICTDLHTADYVINLTRGLLSPHLIPFFTFTISAIIAFSTGTSWATMAILTPIVVPIAYHLPLEVGLAEGYSHSILIGTVGAVLSGSVFGDHCSPISDTTILSSMASAADHVDHVQTQLPYAVVVGIVASLTGYIPSGWGFNPFLSLIVGVILMVGIVYLFGKRHDHDANLDL